MQATFRGGKEGGLEFCGRRQRRWLARHHCMLHGEELSKSARLTLLLALGLTKGNDRLPRLVFTVCLRETTSTIHAKSALVFTRCNQAAHEILARGPFSNLNM
jgi:hypothetical protein